MKRFAIALTIAVIGSLALHGQETRSTTPALERERGRSAMS